MGLPINGPLQMIAELMYQKNLNQSSQHVLSTYLHGSNFIDTEKKQKDYK